jgi:chromosome segregation ATPase
MVEHDQEFQAMAGQIHMVKAYFQHLAGKLSTAEESTARMKEENAFLRNEIERLTGLIEHLAGKLSTTEESTARMEEENELLRNEIERSKRSSQDLARKLSTTETSTARIQEESERLRNEVEQLKQLNEGRFASLEEGLRDLCLQGERAKTVCEQLTREQLTMEVLVRNNASENQLLRKKIRRLKGVSDEQLARHQQELRDLGSQVECLKTVNQSTREGFLSEFEAQEEQLESLFLEVARLKISC